MAWVFKAPGKAPSDDYPCREIAVAAALKSAGVTPSMEAEDRTPQETAWHGLKLAGWAVYEAA